MLTVTPQPAVLPLPAELPALFVLTVTPVSVFSVFQLGLETLFPDLVATVFSVPSFTAGCTCLVVAVFSFTVGCTCLVVAVFSFTVGFTCLVTGEDAINYLDKSKHRKFLN